MSQQIIEIGKRIKNRRLELKLKQSVMAENLDISNNHLSSIENGRENPSIELLIKICDELRVTPDYLLLGTMHSNNVPQDIIEGLRLCSEEDIELTKKMVEILVERNKGRWNNENYIFVSNK